MRTPLYFALIGLWVMWAVPFVARRVRGSSARRSKTDPVAIAGILLQMAGYPLVWRSRYFWTHPLEPWRIAAALVLGAISLWLIWSAIPALGKQWRLQAGVYEDHELVRSGPYRIVRHPIYASMLALLLATGLLLASLTACAIALVLMIAGTEIRVHAEDRLLAERFGAQFTEYRSRVPAYLPFLR